MTALLVRPARRTHATRDRFESTEGDPEAGGARSTHDRAVRGLGNIGAAAATVGDEELSPDYIVPSPGAAALPVRIALPVSGRIMVRVA